MAAEPRAVKALKVADATRRDETNPGIPTMTKTFLTAIFALPMLLSSAEAQAADFGEYKVRIHVTNAEKWKVKWWCNEANGSTSLIDADTYPASTKTTRSTNITPGKCSTGDWKVSFEIKAWGNWKKVQPGANVCTGASCGYSNDGGWTYKTYARPVDFNSSRKLCVSAWNFSFGNIYTLKQGC